MDFSFALFFGDIYAESFFAKTLRYNTVTWLKKNMKALILLLCLFCFSCSLGTRTLPKESNPKDIELPVASLEEAGFNRDSIDNLIDRIHKTPHKDFRGLVVIKDNQLVIEEYFNTFWRISIHDIRSAGKSVTALLLGIAIKEGLIESVEQDVYTLFSQKKNAAIHEDYKKIKLRHLLDMSSGLDADTDRPETMGHAGNWMAKDNWKEYLLNVPLSSQPGEAWVYADMNAVLIGLAIEEASGMSLKAYAQQKLFDPLGIKQLYWYTNASRQTGAAGNLYLSTWDFAKLGLVVVNEGAWDGHQFMDSSYIEELIAHKVFDLSPFAGSYGMLWYKSSGTIRGKKVDYLFASGNGGNHLVVVPDEEMVVALTSSAYGQGYGQGRSLTILQMILSSLE
jgi:CubicO group peptidase (beta-lactamase class C family)